jgi:hypothetical protein
MKIRKAHPEDFDFILKLTRQNIGRLVTEEWNADWEENEIFINSIQIVE